MESTCLIKFACLLVVGFSSVTKPAYAQSLGPAAIDAAGASFSSGAFSYEYAIGQVGADNTHISAALVLTPGVLQPQTNTTGISQNAIAATSLQVYPDPVESTLFIQPAFGNRGKLQMGLFDAAGKLVRRQEIQLETGAELQKMDVTPFAAGNYLLQVTWGSGGESYTSGYKLQKLH